MTNPDTRQIRKPTFKEGTLGHWMQAAEQQLMASDVFLGHGTDNDWDEALHLALPTLNIAPDADRDVLQRTLASDELTRLDNLLRQRIGEHIPVPYLTEIAWFALLPFYVSRDVLIPRSPIAELIECGFSPWVLAEPRTLLDLCCGGGCMGIACAEYMPEVQVDLADISPAALAVAQENIRRYDFAARVNTHQGDLFDALPAGKTYDVIVCNPPYVDAEDMAQLPPEYLHEPRLALEAGQDGLDLVRVILARAADYLNEGGILVVEVGNSWEAVEAQYPEIPFMWLEFERGGHGVFLLYKEQLKKEQLKNDADAFFLAL